ncbi:SCP2 sterol-binding domain-containing protein [Bacillus sp. FJAT-27251]|uniref:SCP2 sterol-binding domain-containing protein n=1 Tax=Bacillus sp. FJAT-27251 TaxID=1684142 RepID=UPI0006A77DA6|nr:SCP2 sterol-binding domain-containing protein [Bacillus sp. FJAT-27251]
MTNSIREKAIPEVWQEIQKALNENPVPYEGVNVVYQYDISGSDAGTYQLLLAGGRAEVVEGSPKEAACTLKLSDKNFKEMMLGNLKGTTAFMMGKLKIDGSIGEALKLEGILQQYDFK